MLRIKSVPHIFKFKVLILLFLDLFYALKKNEFQVLQKPVADRPTIASASGKYHQSAKWSLHCLATFESSYVLLHSVPKTKTTDNFRTQIVQFAVKEPGFQF